jgi:hypothetical protein
MMADQWYSEKDVPNPPVPLKVDAWTDLPWTRWVPTWDGYALLELYVYLRVRIRAGYPTGQIQTQVMREGTDPPDAAAPDDISVGQRNRTLTQIAAGVSPEFGRPIRQVMALACHPDTPLTWQIYVGPEFATVGRSTLYAKAFRVAREWTIQ